MTRPKKTPFHGGKVLGWGFRYNLTHPAVRPFFAAAGREIRWHGITVGQWGFGLLHSVKVRTELHESLARRGNEP